MSRTAAMEEAYAAVRQDVSVIETIQLDHITFDEPVYVVTGVDDDMELGVDGVMVLHRAIPVSIVVPGFTEDGPTQSKLRIDNASDILRPYVKLAAQANTPIMVTYRAYHSDDLAAPGDTIGDLELWDVDLTATVAEATLKFRELEMQQFPLATYDATYYPALQNT